MSQEEQEKWSPETQFDFYNQHVVVEVELARGGGLQKVAYMLMRGPGGPVFGVLVVMLVLHFRGVLNESYFMGLVLLGIGGALALTHRGKPNGS